MPLLPRPEIRDMPVCQHGGIDYAELEALGIAPQDILDFSANLNPFGPPPGVMEALHEYFCQGRSPEAISRYPDSEATCLRHSLAEKLGVSIENILVGSGSTELIRLAALAYLDKGDQVLIIEPTFGEYQVACQIVGASIVKQQASPQNGFRIDIDETIEIIRRHRPRGIFICNPNNPTGRHISQADFEKILDASSGFPEKSGDFSGQSSESLVVLDEAYVSFVDNAWSSLDFILNSSLRAERSNLLILHSMTKDYAIAGLRLGYGVAAKEIIATLRRICPPWNVNVVAQKAGIIAIRSEDYLQRCQAELRRAKNYLVTELSHLGLIPLPSEANFFLVEVGDATAFRQALLRRGILVRDCTSFGLPSYVRIAPLTLPGCQKLVAAVREIIEEKGGLIG